MSISTLLKYFIINNSYDSTQRHSTQFITIISNSKTVQLLPYVFLQDAVFVPDVMSHYGLPVGQILTVALGNWTVEGFAGWEFSRQPLFKVRSSYKIFSFNFQFFKYFDTLYIPRWSCKCR